MLGWDPSLYGVGVAEMDRTHEDFTRLTGEAIRASDEDFPYLLAALVEHTRRHFDNEARLMREFGFPAIAEHESEHRRVLGELVHMLNAVEEGRLRFARLYVSQGLPGWFRNHLATMDAALAGCIKRATATAPAPATGKIRELIDQAP